MFTAVDFSAGVKCIATGQTLAGHGEQIFLVTSQAHCLVELFYPN